VAGRINSSATTANETWWAGRETLQKKLVWSKTTTESPNTAIDFDDDVEEPRSSEASIGASKNEEMSSSHLCRGSGSCTCTRPEETGSCDSAWTITTSPEAEKMQRDESRQADQT